jgi:hypothetical protein
MALPRQYIRHPAFFPVEVQTTADRRDEKPRMMDISYGGLAFYSTACYAENQVITIRIPAPFMELVTECIVKWCRLQSGPEFLVGVEFLNRSNEHQVRMVEQICHIEKYRQDIYEMEGRELDQMEAAEEWIEKYAHTFHLPDNFWERLRADGIMLDE